MSVPLALDTSILSNIATARRPASKIEDRNAIDRLLDLAHRGAVELGIASTCEVMEQRQPGPRKRQVLESRLDGLLHVWPVTVTCAHHAEIERKKACLKKIKQDRDGSDSEIFLVSTLHSQYFLTTDYRYRRQFRQQEGGRIRGQCGITAHVLTPSEFLTIYDSGTIWRSRMRTPNRQLHRRRESGASLAFTAPVQLGRCADKTSIPVK